MKAFKTKLEITLNNGKFIKVFGENNSVMTFDFDDSLDHRINHRIAAFKYAEKKGLEITSHIAHYSHSYVWHCEKAEA
jgi:hypothetical protein